jgi:hypothetical protein
LRRITESPIVAAEALAKAAGYPLHAFAEASARAERTIWDGKDNGKSRTGKGFERVFL